MCSEASQSDQKNAWRRIVSERIEGPSPAGDEFDACRAVLRSEIQADLVFHALCVLLEGALADAGLSIDDTQELVPLLKALANGGVSAEELI